MRAAVLGVVAAVVVGGPFGTGSVEVSGSSGDTIRLEVSVRGPEATPVVVHAVEPGGEQLTTSLVERTPGTHTGRFEARRANLVLVFEDVATGEQAPPVALTEMGVDAGVLSPPRTTTTVAAGPERPVRLGWLALALALGSLSLLAIWALDEGAPPEPEPAAEADVET
jgi:hypothetical protein